jgi:peptide/nickel transport system substrate-binding protein
MKRPLSSPGIGRRLTAGALAGAVALGLTACSGSGSGSTSSAADSDEPVEGGTLRVMAAGANAVSLDPQATEGTTVDGIRWGALYDKLTTMQPDGTVVPSLAETIESNETADEWTVTLRDGIATHDGGTFDADDLIFSVRRILDPATAAKGVDQLAFIDPEGIERVDDLTALFTLPQPFGLFEQVWTGNYMSMVPEGFDPADPIGTGPFTLDSYTPGQESRMSRFDDYWGEVAHVDELVVTDVAEASAQANALRGGQADIIGDVPASEVAAIEGNDQLRIMRNPTWQYFPIIMDVEQAPFDDERVREAMRLIADRDQLVDVALNGYGNVGNDYVARTEACPRPDVDQREQDIEAARQLLEEAGVPDLQLELATTAGAPGMVESATVFAEQAREAGVEISVRNLDPADYLERYGQWQFAVDWIIDDYPGAVQRSLLPGGAFNNSHWNDPEFNELAAQALAEPDLEARCDLFSQMQTIEWERGAQIVWGFSDTLHAHTAQVQGLTPNISGDQLEDLNLVWLG